MVVKLTGSFPAAVLEVPFNDVVGSLPSEIGHLVELSE